MEKLCFLFENFFNDLSSQAVTAFAIGLMFSYVLISLFVSIFKGGYSYKKRLFYIPFALGICLIHTGYCIVYGQIGFVIITFGAGVMLLPFIFLPPVKNKKASKEHLELARYIDEQVKNSGLPFEKPFCETHKTPDEKDVEIGEPPIDTPQKNVAKQILRAVTKPKVETNSDTPDFSHVKNVIERLNYFPLTPSDKKQVNELQITIERAELGEDFPDLKNKVNDGLSSLLKIMSKYGV